MGRVFGNRAPAMLLEVHAIAQEIGSKPAGQSVLEVCAGLGASRGGGEHAAHVCGRAGAETGQTWLHRDPADEAFLAPLIARAREVLGTATFDAAEAAGRGVTSDQALAGGGGGPEE